MARINHSMRPSSARNGLTPALRLIVALLMLATAVGCGNPTRPALVVPTAPVLQAETDATTTISVRALLVAYAGAEAAPKTVVRNREEALQRAHLLANSARSGEENFDTLVQSYSDRPPLADPGAFGLPIDKDSTLLPKPVVNAAFRLSPQGVSAPVPTPAGYYVVMRTTDAPSGPLEVAAKHILISHRDSQRVPEGVSRTREEAQTRAEEVRQQLLEQPDAWDTLAGDYTDEPGARAGGDLGTFGRGQMVPAFEKAVFALDVGGVSEVIETPFGFHVIRRYK